MECWVGVGRSRRRGGKGTVIGVYNEKTILNKKKEEYSAIFKKYVKEKN